jgi:uncharacterized protein (DUF169 family)
LEISTNLIIEKFKKYFKLNESPIAFFYTDEPPQTAFNPHPKNKNKVSCLIQLLNGVRRGRTLVFGKESSRLCLGGLAYLGFKKMVQGIEYYLSTGVPSNKPGELLLEGERFKISPEVAKGLYERVPFQKHPANYAVFMPLENVDLVKYKPALIIFFVNMDQLGGLIQLFNYDTNEGIKLGLSSSCGTIITEPMAEIGRTPVSRAVVGMLSDMLSRNHITKELASFTVSYDRLLQILPLMDKSFLILAAWQKILSRI